MNETRPNLFSSDTEKKTLLNSVLQQLLIIITIQLYSVIAKNSNKRLKLSVAQCLRSYFVLLRGRVLSSLVSGGEVKKVKLRLQF